MLVKEKLIPTLGRYVHFEPRSIFVLDNASIHHSELVVHLIEDAGAKGIYTSLYSLDLNLIELMFSLYNKSLKRNIAKYWANSHVTEIFSVSNSHECIFFNVASHFSEDMMKVMILKMNKNL